ncbi:MAG: hypothetical protein ACQEWM_08915 [Actinomycetota bacterium]
MTDADRATARDEQRVLELRVHGVNNTPPAGLLDLPHYALRQVAGDDRAAFWLAAPETNPREGARGHIPPGIRREAYSWGALVRSESSTGSRGRAFVLLFQVLALPFSIGNAAMWTRRLPTMTGESADEERAARRWAAMTAGGARLFGLALTLLFTTTAVTIAVEIAALQCAVAGRCTTWIWDALWSAVVFVPWADAFLTPSRILALFALVPVAAVALLVWFAGIARHRYDTLHVRPTAAGRGARGESDAERDRSVPLAQAAFWSNRITARLARIHFAAAIALTAVQVSLHVVVLDAASVLHRIALVAGVVILAACIVAVAVLPTMTTTERAPKGPPWTGRLATGLLAVAVVELVALLALLAAGPRLDLPRTGGLGGSELPPLIVVTLAAALALSGVVWRPRGARAGTAWLGCAPAVFMTFSLALAVLTSSVMIALTAAVLTGWGGPERLAIGALSAAGMQVPDIFLAGGGLIAAALAASLLALASFLVPRKLLVDRAEAWRAEDVAEGLMKRLDRRRRLAALIHLVEPATAVIASLLAIAIGLALVWVWSGMPSSEPLSALVGATGSIAGIPIVDILTITPWVVTAVGLVLTVVVALAVLRRESSPLAIVWDVTCFMPRTAQPFGPPCYAERAVPDIAARLDDWLSGRPERRAVLAAHSMGGMIAVAALGLLGSTATEPTVLRRVSLLTFGVQLRTLFGRMMPELVGPAVLGTYPARSPRPWKADPWTSDALDDDGREWLSPPEGGPMARLRGRLLPDDGVPWLNLWRLSDYLGFPAVAGRSSFRRGSISYENAIDRYAQEIDRTVDPPIVVTHNDYIRAPAYGAALRELLDGQGPAAGAAAAAGARQPAEEAAGRRCRA